MQETQELKKVLILALREAGEKVLEYYKEDNYSQERKKDNSLVTQADIEANEIIKKRLSQTQIPILSEESPEDLSRLEAKRVWIVDPLDGTNDFIQKTGEFSILIALVEDKKPLLAGIFVPSKDELYIAEKGKGAYLSINDKEFQRIQVSQRKNLNEFRMLVSRNYFSKEEQEFCESLGMSDFLPCGSIGVKIAELAKGNAEFYFNASKKLGQWDTCAPQLILEEARGEMYNLEGEELVYNNKERKMLRGCVGTNGYEKENILKAIKASSLFMEKNSMQKKKYPKKGFVLWFTGLSGAGKSTVADKVFEKIGKEGLSLERLDGDEVREHLTKGLGFSKEDREENIRRVTFVAKVLSRNGVGVISTFISPYKEMREKVRNEVTNFIEVYVNAPLAVCEERDIKGLYKKARAGEIKHFTGIDDPYEVPENPELELDTDKESIEESAQKVIEYLKEKDFI
jgi:3'(2'),5'-bisphosphate nucleotidase